MDVTQALAELMELSSQVQRAVVFDRDGSVLGSTEADGAAAEGLAGAAVELVAAAAALRSAQDEVTRVEVVLDEGGLFCLREGERLIAATTGPHPTAGLVAYDLRTCLESIDATPAKRRRAPRKRKSEDAE